MNVYGYPQSTSKYLCVCQFPHSIMPDCLITSTIEYQLHRLRLPAFRYSTGATHPGPCIASQNLAMIKRHTHENPKSASRIGIQANRKRAWISLLSKRKQSPRELSSEGDDGEGWNNIDADLERQLDLDVNRSFTNYNLNQKDIIMYRKRLKKLLVFVFSKFKWSHIVNQVTLLSRLS